MGQISTQICGFSGSVLNANQQQALQLPLSGSEPTLLPVKIQDALLPVSDVAASIDDASFAAASSLTLSLRSGTQLCISQLTPALLRTVLASLR